MSNDELYLSIPDNLGLPRYGTPLDLSVFRADVS